VSIMNAKSVRKHFTKEGETDPEVLAQIRRVSLLPHLSSLANRVGSVAFLASRSAPTFQPLRDVPIAGVVGNLCSKHHEQGEKDKNAFIWGDCVEARCNANMRSMEAFAFDFDGAISLDALKARIGAKGCTALLYTTYSHGKTSTTVSAERYRVFANEYGLAFPPTRATMAKFLKENQLGHLQNIVFDLSPGNLNKHIVTASEASYVVFHDPVEKLRVILFLAETMPLADDDGVGIDGYKVIYEKAALDVFGSDALKIIDPSCKTPCQPIYLPAKPIGSAVDHQIHAFDGRLWSWRPVWRDVVGEVEERRRKIAERRRMFEGATYDLKVLQIAECLKRIPADDYDVWIRCLIAIFNETDGSGEGLNLAHTWSATIPDKYDADGLDRKWVSFGETSIASARVGLGTLVFLARQYRPDFQLDGDRSDFDLGLIGL